MLIDAAQILLALLILFLLAIVVIIFIFIILINYNRAAVVEALASSSLAYLPA
jgi:hypothetical protein